MADEIKQVIGLDVGQALQALQQLDKGYANFETRITSVVQKLDAQNKMAGKTVAALKKIRSEAEAAAKALDRLNKTQTAGTRAGTSRPARQSSPKLLTGAAAGNALNQLLGGPSAQNIQQQQAAANSLISSLRNVGTTAQTQLAAANQATQKWTISWETLTRVVATQLIVRALSQIRNAINQAVDDAIEFQRQVALIQTIADGAGFQQIADSVREISDNFNIPLLETAKGVYQALSNQVGDFGDSLRFTVEAAKFAKATNSTLADSVDLLSGALRSFGLTVEDTGQVSGIFFTAIDKGRVTATELANAFGRVGPSAKEIGISLEELAAAAATISDKGIGTSETLTQFRGIITALTKPTNEMKKRFRELGFGSVETAIQTRGLSGVLKDLSEATDGGTQSFAKLFPNVRGIGGALSLTGDNLKTFADNIDEARANGEDFANEKFLIATATDAEKLTKALNQVKNAFTVELGQAIVEFGANLLGSEKAVEVITFSVKTLAGSLPALAAGLLTVGGALAVLKLGMLALAGPTSIVIAALAAVAIGTTVAFEAIDQARKKLAFSEVSALAAQNKKDLEDFRKTQNDKLKEAKALDDTIIKGVNSRFQKIAAQYFRDVDAAQSSNKALIDNTEKALDRVVNARQRVVNALASAIEQSDNLIQQSQNRIADIQQRQSDRRFEFNTRNLSDAQKAGLLIGRAADEARAAEAALIKAFRTGDDNLKQRALAQFQRADSIAAEAQSIGQRAGSRALESRAAKELEQIARRQIGAEERINDLQRQRVEAQKKEKAAQEEILRQIREQQQIVLDNTGQFDKQGQLFDPDEEARRAQKRQEALKKIAGLAFKSSDFKAADALGLGNLVRDIQGDLAQTPIKLQFDIESAVQQLSAGIRKSLSNLDVQFPFLKSLEAAVGETLRNSADQIPRALNQVAAEAQGIRGRQTDQSILDQEIVKQRAEIESLLQKLASRAPLREQVSDSLKPAADATNKAIADIRELASQDNINIGAIQVELDKLGKTDFGGKFGTLQTDARLIGDAFLRAAKLSESLKKIAPVTPEEAARLQVLESILNGAGVSNLISASQALSANATTAVIPTTTIATNSQTTATNYGVALDQLQQMAKIGVPSGNITVAQATVGGAQGRTLLGQKGMYFAQGGTVNRGMDTLDVKARAGESIINPNSTRKFFSQIQAINAGKPPIFRSEGGGVTNIGDIKISVNGSESPQATAREVMKAFRREKRRGSGR